MFAPSALLVLLIFDFESILPIRNGRSKNGLLVTKTDIQVTVPLLTFATGGRVSRNVYSH